MVSRARAFSVLLAMVFCGLSHQGHAGHRVRVLLFIHWGGGGEIAAGKYEDLDPGMEVQACNLSAGPVGTSRPVQFSQTQKPASQLSLPGKLQTHDSVSFKKKKSGCL